MFIIINCITSVATGLNKEADQKKSMNLRDATALLKAEALRRYRRRHKSSFDRHEKAIDAELARSKEAAQNQGLKKSSRSPGPTTPGILEEGEPVDDVFEGSEEEDDEMIPSTSAGDTLEDTGDTLDEETNAKEISDEAFGIPNKAGGSSAKNKYDDTLDELVGDLNDEEDIDDALDKMTRQRLEKMAKGFGLKEEDHVSNGEEKGSRSRSARSGDRAGSGTASPGDEYRGTGEEDSSRQNRSAREGSRVSLAEAEGRQNSTLSGRTSHQGNQNIKHGKSAGRYRGYDYDEEMEKTSSPQSRGEKERRKETGSVLEDEPLSDSDNATQPGQQRKGKDGIRPEEDSGTERTVRTPITGRNSGLSSARGRKPTDDRGDSPTVDQDSESASDMGEEYSGQQVLSSSQITRGLGGRAKQQASAREALPQERKRRASSEALLNMLMQSGSTSDSEEGSVPVCMGHLCTLIFLCTVQSVWSTHISRLCFSRQLKHTSPPFFLCMDSSLALFQIHYSSQGHHLHVGDSFMYSASIFYVFFIGL